MCYSITPILNAMRDWGADYMSNKGMDANCVMMLKDESLPITVDDS